MSDYSTTFDEELLHLGRQGNLDATEALLIRYQKLVNRIVRSFYVLGFERDDLIQEGMLALYLATEKYNDEKNASFKTFATMCIKNRIYDLIRSSQRGPSLPPISLDVLDDLIQRDDVDDNSGFYALLEKINLTLSAKDNRLFNLYLDGFSYAEIGDKLGLGTKKVDNSLQKIKSRLQKTLLESGFLTNN